MVDENTRTTFIPKQQLVKPRIEKQKKSFLSGGFLGLIAWILISVSVLSSIGVFAYQQILKSNIASMAESISRAEQLFDSGLIVELKELDIRLSSANELLKKHLDFSRLFKYLGDTTLPDISYESFRFDARDGVPIVAMTGEATRFTPIAIQSDVYGQNEFMENHVFSSFSLTNRGTILFDLTFQINEEELAYIGIQSEQLTEEDIPVEDVISEGEIDNRIITEEEQQNDQE